MDFELLIIIALTIGATFLVVVASLGLVIHKAINTRTLQRRQRLYSLYSDKIAKLLMQDLPPLPINARTSAIFEQYEFMIQHIKHRLEVMSPARQVHERESLRLVLIDFVKDVSGEVLDRLVYFFYAFGFVDEQIKLLSDRRWWVRAQAARDAGLLKARRAITPLTATLEDEHLDVRIQAMESLVRLVGVDALRTIFRVSKNMSLWTSIELSTIVMEYKEEALPHLLEGLECTDQSVILFCIEMLAEIGFVIAVEPLRQMASDFPNMTVRAKAIEALGRLGDERAELLLTSYIDNSFPPIRLKSMEALQKIGAPQPIPKLLQRFHNGGLNEKVIAARAIASTGESGMQVLQAQVLSNDPLSIAVAEQVMEEYHLSRNA